MKGRVLVAIIVVLGYASASPAVAQVAWEAGFKGGLSASSLRGDTGFSGSETDGVNTIDLSGDIGDSRTAFAGGAFAAAEFTDAFGIRLEVLYAQRGGKGKVNLAFNGSPAGTADVTFKVDYVEIPILAVGSLPATGRTRVNFFGGPSVAFKTGAKVKIESSGTSDEQDNNDEVESTDFGLTAGAGLKMSASPKVNFVMDGRYTFGLSKVPKSGEDIKNGGFALMAGLSFALGGSH